MATEEGDGEGGPLRRPRAQALAIEPSPTRTIHADSRLTPAAHRPPRRSRRVSAPRSGLPLYEGKRGRFLTALGLLFVLLIKLLLDSPFLTQLLGSPSLIKKRKKERNLALVITVFILVSY